MFGYVRPQIPSLRVREYELYRAVYCGLCRSMGQVSGQASRLTLSYDFAFLALVRLILSEETPVFEPHRCPAHPLHRRLMAEDHPVLRYTSAAAAYLAEAKRLDDRADETGLAAVKPVLLRPLTAGMVHRSGRREPDSAALFPMIRSHLGRLSELEKAGCTSPDEAADCFGDLLGDVFAYGLSGSSEAVSRSIGRSTGRFLYLCDALDDLPEDIHAGRYNPLAGLWGELALGEDGKPSPMVREAFQVSALLDLEKAGLAAELLPSGILTEIVKNILYLGMPDMIRTVVSGRSPKAVRGLGAIHVPTDGTDPDPAAGEAVTAQPDTASKQTTDGRNT